MRPKPKLGFALDPDTSAISAVHAGGLAERAGIRVDDFLLELDGLKPVEFLASAWWPRDDNRPILVKLQRGDRVVWHLLTFADLAEPTASSPADPSPADPFRGLLDRAPHRAGDEETEIADLRRAVAGLTEQVARAAPPKPKPLPQPGEETELVFPRHFYGAPPLREDDRRRNGGLAEQMWLEQHGRTGREPMGGTQS